MAEGEDRASSAERPAKSPEAFRTISEVASELDVAPHVLRFWESKFSQIRPLKRGGRRRYYRPEDVELLRQIRTLLYVQGYTIRGVQKVLREEGPRGVLAKGRGGDGAPAEEAQEGEAGPRLSERQRARIEAAIEELTALRELLKRVLG